MDLLKWWNKQDVMKKLAYSNSIGKSHPFQLTILDIKNFKNKTK